MADSLKEALARVQAVLAKPRRNLDGQEYQWFAFDDVKALVDALSAQPAPQPVKMILFCPACGLQHVDEPEPSLGPRFHDPGNREEWTNPPHRSHLCLGCGHIWRPADVPTEGVESIATAGKNDSPPPAPQPSADIERLERIAAQFEEQRYPLKAVTDGVGRTRLMSRSDREIAEALANAAAIRSAISSQTSPQGKQGVRTELARLGSQEATPNTGVKLEGGGG